jgi:DNA-binding transcriptional ArsR family regulator
MFLHTIRKIVFKEKIMITIHMTQDDLVGMRFAYRPLLEIPLSFRVLQNPAFQSPFLRWVDEAFYAVHDLDLPYLNALVMPTGYIPDFITPTPLSSRVSIEDDFADILATPDEVIRQDILTLIREHGDSEIRRYFLAHPREAVFCLVEEMREYWHRVLAHYWSRMVSSLEGDVLYRGRTLALEGPGPVFEDLHGTISYQKAELQLKPICQCLHADVEFQLNGDGLQLVPTIFRGCGRMFLLTPGWQPMLAYGVRGSGLWHRAAPPPSQSLELALGTGRARVLQVLITPSTTSEVAHKLRISSATASQHLSRLTKAGLSIPRRSGRRVYYQLTERGEHLIALFAASA